MGDARVISIHALRKESDGTDKWLSDLELLISIHALRKESDTAQAAWTSGTLAFQSTLSVRRATRTGEHQRHDQLISIHALRKESDLRFATTSPLRVYFNPRSP